MRYLLLCFVFLAGQMAFAQSAQLVFGTLENEENYPMIRLQNGNYLLAGNTKSFGFGGKDVFVTYTDAAGNMIWSRQYGGSGDETALSVSETSDGGFVIGGESFSNDPNGDAFIFKIDVNGTMQWWKEYGDGLYDITYSVLGLADGSIISAGLLETAPVDYDAFLMKTDANGDTLWTKVIGVPGIDHAVNVIQTSDSGFIFCGKTLSRGQGLCDCWLVKTDMNGDTLWTRTYGGAGWDESMDIIEQANGYIVCGGTNSEGNSNYDFLLMQIDFNGNLVWVKQYGGYNVEASYCVQEAPNEGYIVAGYTETYSYTNSRGTDSANAWILKTNYTGDTLWAMVYGGNLKEECFSVAVVPNVGYAFSGYTQSFGDSLQTYLFHTDTAGYTGCLERRTSPDILIPSFMQGSYAFNLSAGYQVTSPAMLQIATATIRSLNCGSPVEVNTISSETGFTFYPNPAGRSVTVRSASPMKSCCVRDATGKLVACTYAEPGIRTDLKINLPPVSGLYTLEVIFADGCLKSEPILLMQE